MLRGDGLPWFYDQIEEPPTELGGRKHCNYNIDDFGHFVSQLAWMHQGRFKRIDGSNRDIIQMPFALSPLKEGMEMVNWRTGTKYTIKQVIHQYRQANYREPVINNVPESMILPERVWRGFHPDELTGATVQITTDNFDLDPKMGDFLSIESSNRLAIRQALAGARDDLSGNDTGDHAPYRIRYRVELSQPGFGKKFFEDPQGVKAAARPAVELQTHDPAVIASVSGQYFDNLVRFELEADNAFELNILTNWFELFMDRHISVLERIGYNRVLYWDRREVEDSNLERAGAGAKRRVRYAVRTERIWPGVKPVLRQVDLEVYPKNSQED